MPRRQNPNLEILMRAVEQLGELADEMVFLGGCATGLLITDPAAPPIRVTRDVDAIVQVLTLADYHQLETRLRAHGFREDASDDAPVCRWTASDVILDVMPADEKILGFGNKWYAAASQNADFILLPSARQIRRVSAPYFLITKLEAFDGRGNGDYLMSHDMEDIVAVLDGRASIVNEVQCSAPELARELAARFHGLRRNNAFLEAVAGHMPTDSVSQARVPMVLDTITELSRI
ncbi:MAG: hypothetical protein HZT40_12135 [Candidatus Thiothrix singaporensis]|uniref:Nucleotidyl transferase AbiEii toxin, Type IV TA system n=1 Tax=Candidatus Thiothrix singaporensis TaxID=2799669 RepID=A0A7L6ASY5_9GAMM|nr:MAG: hypothetical protein HZT40_12135 [Candidatus Thiothrix singaporensis]